MRPATYALLATNRCTRPALAASQRRSRARDPGHDQALERAEAPRSEVVVVAVPHVAHRRVAVAQVERARPGADPLGDAVGAGDDEVETPKVEALRGRGEQRQVAPIVSLDAREVLDEGRADVPRLELRRHRPADVEQGVDGRLGKEACEGEEDLLPSAHSREPVVNECDLQRVASARAARGRPRAFMYPSWTARAERSQLNARARTRPLSTSRSRRSSSSRTWQIPVAMSSTL